MDRILDYRTDKKALLTPGSEITADMINTAAFEEKLKSLKNLLEEDGIGLAATQIGWPVKLFLLSIDEDEEQTEKKVFINPKLLSVSKKQVKIIEGCLSLKGLFLKISRPESITWEYETLDGKKIKQQVGGLYARAVLHEYGHCLGEVFLKHATSVQKLKVKKWLQR